MTKLFPSAEQLFYSSIFKVEQDGKNILSVADPTSIGSYFGRKNRAYREVINYSFALENPRNRFVTNRARKASLGFAVANFIWVLLGRKDVESISFYNSRGYAFSSDGEYYESAFGDRIFGSAGIWQEIKALLLSDPSTRRAFIPLLTPEDIRNRPRDTSCAVGFQLLNRDSKLDFLLSMRSQSVALVMPYDIFLFTMLHEFMSIELGLDLGCFYYTANSLHYYLDEKPLIKEILRSRSGNQLNAPDFGSMTYISPAELSNLSAAENIIRESIIKNASCPEYLFSMFDPYWARLLKIVWVKGCLEQGFYPAGLGEVLQSLKITEVI